MPAHCTIPQSRAAYIKAWRTENKEHLRSSGVRTNIVTSVEVSPWMSNDSPYLPALLTETARNFQIAEVSADKGYLSKKNVAAITEIGADPFIPFRTHTPSDVQCWE